MSIEELKAIVKVIATRAVEVCPATPDEEHYAKLICQQFPKSAENPDGKDNDHAKLDK